MFYLDKLHLKLLPESPSGVLRAQEIFLDEIELRSGIQLSSSNGPGTLILDTIERIEQYEPELTPILSRMESPGKEGFLIHIDREQNLLVIAGRDARGCMYGAARVLRKSELRKGSAIVSDELVDQSRTPKYEMRGHQYGYRDKQNTCPRWTDSDFERYIRDMILFGSNYVELIPPSSDDARFSPSFTQDPLVTLIHWSTIAHSYGMDVSMWCPNANKNYDLPEIRCEELAVREEIFSKIPYLDSILIPAGDPGELKPHQFFQVVGESMRILHKYHPNAKVYISQQGFSLSKEECEEFYEEVAKQPDWLYGLCYAPWNPDTIEEMQRRIPQKYRDRTRFYPDITHNATCQFEVPEWDIAFVLSQGREGYTSRPRAMKLIHNLYSPYTIGSITYSEGIHDDINKVVWGDQDFDPTMSPKETLRDYVRLFIDPDLTDELSDMLMALEDNWVGDIEQNIGIDNLYEHFLTLEQRVSDEVRANYRFKMALLRSMSDYQTKCRAIYDRALQRKAEFVLARAPEIGADRAVFEARNVLNRTYTEPVCYEVTQKMFALGEELFKTPGCRIKLSSKLYLGQSWARGAWLDCARSPLNDYQWYTVHFKRISSLCDEQEKLSYIQELLHRTDPGEGGQYLCLGDIQTFRKNVVHPLRYEEDPGAMRSPAVIYDLFGIISRMKSMEGWYNEYPIPLNWVKRVRALYSTPLIVKITDLDPDTDYKLCVTYSELIGSDSRAGGPETSKIALYAGDVLVHHCIRISGGMDHVPVYEYSIPREAYRNGDLTLTWRSRETLWDLSVSELWIKKIV